MSTTAAAGMSPPTATTDRWEELVPLNSDQGQSLLDAAIKSGSALHHPDTQAVWVRQTGRTYCGVVTATIIHNALRSRGMLGGPSLGGLLDEQAGLQVLVTNNVLDRATVDKMGMTLPEHARVLEAMGLGGTTVVHAQHTPIDEMLALMRSALADPGCAVSLNYHMSTLGQTPFGGHISPVSAYEPATGRFLVMDVWPQTEPVWATGKTVYQAMAGLDQASGLSRGVCIVRPPR